MPTYPTSEPFFYQFECIEVGMIQQLYWRGYREAWDDGADDSWESRSTGTNATVMRIEVMSQQEDSNYVPLEIYLQIYTFFLTSLLLYVESFQMMDYYTWLHLMAKSKECPPKTPTKNLTTYQATFLPRLNGCASVLKTHSSKLIRPGSSKIKYKYFKVSANQKLSWLLLWYHPPGVKTSLMALYPYGALVTAEIWWKADHAQSW